MAVHPKKLLVEGDTDRRVVPYLMEANGVDWPADPPVFIASYNGVSKILKPEVIEAEMKASGLEALGVVVDANGDAAARWNQVRTWCGSEFAELPDQIPAEGLQTVHSSGPRFGVWIMPDNRFTGMLEDFLVRLIPDDSRGLYELAQRCVGEASGNGAPFRAVHRTKAEIHTWLAWQDEPAPQLHEAVARQVLKPTRPESHSFASWFRILFQV